MRKKLSVFISMSIMVLMLAACGSSNNSTPSSSDVPNVKEETSTTGQIENEKIENSNGDESSVDSSVDSTSTPEPTPTETPTSTPEPTPTETPTPTPEPTPTETPTPTPEPTPTETPTPTPEPTPTETPTPTPEPTVPPVEDDPTPSNPGWNGGYDKLPSDGFDHIKVPTIDDFYDEGLSNNDGAFDFGNRPEWEDAWYDAYDEFLVANGSPIDPDTGKPMGAFNAIHDGFTRGYQYLYYGFSQGATNGWGDIVIMPYGMTSRSDNPSYKDSYFLETSFVYGTIDKGLENEYRAATSMMLSWICPNPSQVEKVIYEFHVDTTGDALLTKHVLANGYGTWMQVGEVDMCVYYAHEDGVGVAIRNHQ